MKRDNRQRRQIPAEMIIPVTQDKKKIDFKKPYKFIYFDWWFEILTMPVYLICTLLVGACALYFKLKVSGRENMSILRKQGCIVISNHCHYLDTIFINYTLFPRHLYTAVAQRNYEVPYVRRLLRFLRAFPIPKGARGLKKIIKPIGEALRRGRHVLIMPEGDLCLMSQEIFSFKPGAFYLSYYHQAPILPIVYVLAPRDKSDASPRPGRLRFHQVIGPPLYPPPRAADETIAGEALDAMMDHAAQWMEDTIASFQPHSD
ncbi:MAG: lysophospholipid acyltransferase family protein [Kiritimatiellae bacterium]|nr:lysophospholipid acyltransferase family protein [Kiritimatiellia bacterium]